MGQPVLVILDDLGLKQTLRSGALETDKIRRIGNDNVVVTSIPIFVDKEIRGVAATFKEASLIQKTEHKLRLKLHSKGFVAKHTFHHINTCSKAMKSAIERAQKYATTDDSILIEGETGTGKRSFCAEHS